MTTDSVTNAIAAGLQDSCFAPAGGTVGRGIGGCKLTDAWRQYLGADSQVSRDWRIRTCAVRQHADRQRSLRKLRERSLAVDSLTRKCSASEGSVTAYDGAVRACFPSESWCREEDVSTLQAGRCSGCGGVDVMLRFPLSNASSGSVSVKCPPTHIGNLTRLCTARGWHSLEGQCIRKTCPGFSVDLTDQVWSFMKGMGYDMPLNEWASPRWLQMQRIGASLNFDALPEGESATVPCPRPPPDWPTQTAQVYPVRGITFGRFYHTFAPGNVTRRCLPHSQTWGQMEGACVLQQCAAGPQLLHLGTAEVPLQRRIQLPAVDLGMAARVDCCGQFTNAGGCADPMALHGTIEVACGLDGNWLKNPTKGACMPANISLRMDGGVVRARKLYEHMRRHILNGHGSRQFMVSKETLIPGGVLPKRSLPPGGVLGSISVRLGHEWRRLAAKQLFTYYDKNTGDGNVTGGWSVDSLAKWMVLDQSQSRSRQASGRSLAATARVACRQLGYVAAPLVLPCAALVLLEAATTSNDTTSVHCQGRDFSESSLDDERIAQGGWSCSHWSNRCAFPVMQLLSKVAV
eukprot:SAG25_NODE_1041_length_4198_cov_3.851915_4_plen_574_part_00